MFITWKIIKVEDSVLLVLDGSNFFSYQFLSIPCQLSTGNEDFLKSDAIILYYKAYCMQHKA